MKIYCLSIYPNHLENFKKMNLIPVGLGNELFDHNWLTDKGANFISDKNENFGEYTFHYKLWKSKINDHDDWIGFCSYRRFWTKISNEKISSFEDLDKIIIKTTPEHWNKYDVILGNPLIFNKIKNIKLIKRNFFEILKKPSVLFKRNTLEDQFRIFHGSFFLDEAINLLSEKYQKNFKLFLSNYELYPYNMFICKNNKILNHFYSELFPWLFSCEEKFKNSNLKGYDKKRIYGFLAERYMPFWFKTNYKTTTCPITFFENK